MHIFNPERFFSNFPRLDKATQPTSRYTPRYNCIAWALGFDDRPWWPAKPDMYWPRDCPDEPTISAFTAAFATLGYEPCDDWCLEKGYEKIALYVNANGPTHAARQLKNGCWTSKCGGNVDIEHKLRDLEGPLYGKVVMFFRRLKKLL